MLATSVFGTQRIKKATTRTLVPSRLALSSAVATSLLVKLYAATSILALALRMAASTLAIAVPPGDNPVVIRVSLAVVVRGVSVIASNSMLSNVLVPVIIVSLN